MRNNPEADIRSNFEIDDVVKPGNMNALASSIQYDYVVTEEMIQAAIDGGAAVIDVDALLGGNKIAERTGEYHVLINTSTKTTHTFKFNGNGVGGPAGSLKVHVYALGRYTAKVTGYHPQVTFYFHTFGEVGAVTLQGVGYNTYVGSFNMEAPVQAPAGSNFVYETALGAFPNAPDDNISLRREAWLSNAVAAVGGGSRAIVTLLDYKRIGAPNTGIPSAAWPLYARWQSSSGYKGEIAASSIFPAGTAPGVKVPRCLVPRAKSDYNGGYLPVPLTDATGALQFRNMSGNWAPNIYSSFGTLQGFVLSDSAFGCALLGTPGGPTTIKINNQTTQIDIFATLGLVFDDTGALLPALGRDEAWFFDVADMDEGQVIEMNIHIVDFPPAKQTLHADLGLEHFIGDWDSATTYTIGGLVTKEQGSAGHTHYNFYRSLKNDNIGNDPGASPEWWETVSGDTVDNKGVYHAATPHNSNARAHLLFEDGTLLRTFAWGYGTSGTSIHSQYPCPELNNRVNVTFGAPKEIGYNGSAAVHVPSMPIAASAKVIFTKIITEGGPAIIILTGGYCSPAYPNY